MDEEWARRVLDLEEEGVGTPGAEEPPLTSLGYSEEVARLDLIADRIMSVRTAVQASYADKHQEPHFEPIKRPTTAIEKERERRARKVLVGIEAEIFGVGLPLGD